MRVAITTSAFAAVDRTPLEWLDQAGIEYKPNPYGRRLTKAEAIEFFSDVAGVLAGLEPLDAEVFAANPQLKAIARVGIGTANVDFSAAEKHGIKVSNTPSGPTEAVAEMTLAGALAILRDLAGKSHALHQGEWPKGVVLGLAALQVLFVGFGRIGRRTAELFHTLGAKVLFYDPHVSPSDVPAWASPVETLHAGLGQVRLVTLHCSGEAQVIGHEELACMPPQSYLLNSARGGLVDEHAICDALDSGQLAGVWMDAFSQEPYSGPLTQQPKALLTPHTSTYTEQCRLSMESEAVKNIIRDLGR